MCVCQIHISIWHTYISIWHTHIEQVSFSLSLSRKSFFSHSLCWFFLHGCVCTCMSVHVCVCVCMYRLLSSGRGLFSQLDIGSKTHRMPKVAGHFSQKSHQFQGSFTENDPWRYGIQWLYATLYVNNTQRTHSVWLYHRFNVHLHLSWYP